MTWNIEKLDLDAYLARIGCGGPLEPTFETLRQVHLAHVRSIPFENLDVLLGFALKRHLARIRLGRYHLPRSHATLTVEVDGRTWLADRRGTPVGPAGPPGHPGHRGGCGGPAAQALTLAGDPAGPATSCRSARQVSSSAHCTSSKTIGGPGNG
ncbi:arylamine N-acetyltransferase [Nonomuraea helvata]|uniref:Arylamine N-acetyltransferase n=1 Tax=Nonomuraea helvata TaxID=37484 RepID=A0ABV5SJV9_9ACTN